jgi:uncharacterized protein
MYQNGQGVLQDYHKAMEFYVKSANQEDANAQFNIGIFSFHSNIILATDDLIWTGFMYKNGQGVPQDYHKAMEFYLKSANQGNAFAQNNIGMNLFHSNLTVTTNYFNLNRIYVF